jgi:hypothetical protein
MDALFFVSLELTVDTVEKIARWIRRPARRTVPAFLFLVVRRLRVQPQADDLEVIGVAWCSVGIES